MITISISKALICFLGVCHPVLVGPETPTGEFALIKRITEDPGYDGEVIQFEETEEYVYAIHRVWLGRPQEKRLQRLKSKNPKDRVISKGCVNVMPEVYKELTECCMDQKLLIEK